MTRLMNSTLASTHAITAATLLLSALGGHGQVAVATPVAVPQPAAVASAPATPAANAKKPGTVRLGIVMPKSQLNAQQGPSAGEPLRALLSQYLNGPSVEVVSIAALLPQQIDAEAATKGCDYLVYSSLSQKKSGGGMGFMKGAGSFSNMMPIMGSANAMRSMVATTMAVNAAEQAVSLSSGLKAKTEVTLEYHVTAIGSPVTVVSNSLNAKTTSDGEDVITPLVEQEAQAIINSVNKKS